VEVVGPKCSTTFGTLAEPGVVAVLDALGAEDMEALGEHCVLLASAAAGAVQFGLQENSNSSYNRASPSFPEEGHPKIPVGSLNACIHPQSLQTIPEHKTGLCLGS